MSTLYFWILLALIGLALYALPALWVRPMYEGYENAPVPSVPAAPTAPASAPAIMAAVTGNTTSTGPAATTTPALQETSPQSAPQEPAPSTAITNSAPKLLEQQPTQTVKPTPQNFTNIMRALEAIQTPPINSKSPELLPSPTAKTPTPTASGANAQPEHAATTKSQPAEPVRQSQDSGKSLVQGEAFQSLCPKPPVVKNEVKQCPDMSQYIRKDSIPCWGCKLA
jgi:hypothetical protein